MPNNISQSIENDPVNDRKQSLAKRATKAGIWIMAGRVAQQVIAMGRIIVLARLLSPDDFGVMGVALSVTLVVNVLLDTGFRSALIQHDGDISKSLNTAWTASVIRLSIIGLILAASSSLIAGLFALPESTPILRIASLSLVIAGFQNIATVYLRRELRSRDELAMKLGSTVADSVVAVVLAFTIGSVWALAWGSLAGSIAYTALSYIVYPYRPRFELRRSELSWMFAFGKWMTLDAFASVAASQIDRLGIARILGAGALGLYAVGGRISLIFVTELTEVGMRVIFPALSKVQNNAALLRRYSIGVIELGFTLVLPLSIYIAFLAEELVIGVLGSNWDSAIGITQVLALVAVPMSIARLMKLPLQSAGYSAVSARSNIVTLAIIAIGVIPVSHRWGLEGIGWLIFAGYAIAIIPLMIDWQNKLGIPPARLAASLLPGILIALVIAGPILWIKSTGLSHWTILAFATLVTAALYCSLTFGSWRLFHRGPVALVALFRAGTKSK